MSVLPGLPYSACALAGQIRKARPSFNHAARSSRNSVRRTLPKSSRGEALTISQHRNPIAGLDARGREHCQFVFWAPLE